MKSDYARVYTPIRENAEKYKALYDRYERLGAFVEQEIMRKR